MTSGHASFSPSCARLGDFIPIARRLCLFHSQYKHVRLFFTLEPVKVLLRCQFLIRILVVLPLRKHIIDQPDGQQVGVGDADTELYSGRRAGSVFPAHFSGFSGFHLRLHVQTPQFDQLGQDLVDGEGVELVETPPGCPAPLPGPA